MKPENFPGRKNDKRIDALARLLEQKPVTDEQKEKIAREIKHLESTITSPGEAYAVRTKKNRSVK